MKPLEIVLQEMIAKPLVQEVAQEYDAIIEELGSIDPSKGSLEMVACVLIAFQRRELLKTPTDWWQPS